MNKKKNNQMKNIIKLSVYIVINFTIIFSAFSQDNPDLKRVPPQRFNLMKLHPDSLPYLGQTPPDTIPEIFGPNFISTNNGDEYSICFSQDGKEIYFSRYTPNVSNTIWWTHDVNNAWTTPVYATFVGSYYNSEPFITTDNQKMYFISERNAANDFQIWYMNRIGTAWSTPQKLTAPFSLEKTKMFPTVASNGNLYFTQWDESTKSYFYMAKNNNGVFDTPVKLSTVINTFYIHGHAFIASDESYLVFDVIPTQQSTGSKIYVSFKKADSTWGTPIILGNSINSTDNQYCPYISPDGKYLFFTRQEDMWWVDSKVVTRLKPTIGIKKEGEIIPEDFQLFQNYPNPFNPKTVIGFQIKDSRFVTLKIFDILGKEIATFVNEKLQPGTYEVPFSANQLPSGVYLYRLNAGDFSEVKKMIILK